MSFPPDGVPNGDELAHQIAFELGKPATESQKVVGIQLSLGNCTPRDIFLVLPKAQFGEVTGALVGKDIHFDRKNVIADEKKVSELLPQAIQFQRNVMSTIYSAKVQAAASGVTSVSSTDIRDTNDLLLRLIQTSITRFGVLAVIGFLVSILVSLYRYNIRLAAFYTARADVLRLCGEQTTVTDFALMAAALSPQLEFGKAPQPPISQLADLVKSMKDAK